MRKKADLLLILITLSLYIINQLTKADIVSPFIRWFMCCYFNDFIGGITFTSYVDIILLSKNLTLDTLWKIELLMLGCGLFWEFITPLFRKNTVCDIWDIVAYLLGGLAYYYIFIILNIKNEQQ